MITHEGESEFLKMIFHGDDSLIAPAGNFYLGLCNQTPAKADLLTDINTEPSVTNGYARQAISRDTTGFPTIEIINNETRIVSLVVTFTAIGGDFSASFTRAFLTDQASGTVGALLCYSGAYSAPITILDGQSRTMKFEFYP